MRKNHSTGIKAATQLTQKQTIFQLMPDKKSTKIPEAAIKIEVPKSGCLAIKMVGITTMIKPRNKFFNDVGKGFWPINPAIIKGTASFSNSEG